MPSAQNFFKPVASSFTGKAAAHAAERSAGLFRRIRHGMASPSAIAEPQIEPCARSEVHASISLRYASHSADLVGSALRHLQKRSENVQERERVSGYAIGVRK